MLDGRALAGLLSRAGRPVRHAARGTDDHGLTEREVEVVRLIAAGRSNVQLARELVVSRATIKTHVNHGPAKTGCRDRAALASWAYARPLV